MENIDTYKKAKEKANLEINDHLKAHQQYNESTVLAIAYLNEYLPWYKVKFKKKGGGYIQESIILELKSLFGNNVDVKIIKKYLAKRGIISTTQLFVISLIIMPLIMTFLFYTIVQLEDKSIYFIFYYGVFSACCIFACIWNETSLIRLYRIKEIKMKE